ncbi:MAG TPA: Rho termination factor N-terminal domain-containing protein, partial [Actinomycetota bacterium]|nr:Rho termination factor N-terminal domain-containing protein [Actinomycetota bacterium]
MSERLDRSVLESKAVAELRAIAKSLDLKVGGLRKSEIIDAIASSNGGRPKSSAKVAGGNGASAPEASKESKDSTSAPASKQRETAPPLDTPGDSDKSSQGSDKRTFVDEGAVSEREPRSDNRNNQRRGRPQGRDNRQRPREKADPREGRGRRRRRGRGGTGG